MVKGVEYFKEWVTEARKGPQYIDNFAEFNPNGEFWKKYVRDRDFADFRPPREMELAHNKAVMSGDRSSFILKTIYDDWKRMHEQSGEKAARERWAMHVGINEIEPGLEALASGNMEYAEACFRDAYMLIEKHRHTRGVDKLVAAVMRDSCYREEEHYTEKTRQAINSTVAVFRNFLYRDEKNELKPREDLSEEDKRLVELLYSNTAALYRLRDKHGDAAKKRYAVMEKMYNTIMGNWHFRGPKISLKEIDEIVEEALGSIRLTPVINTA